MPSTCVLRTIALPFSRVLPQLPLTGPGASQTIRTYSLGEGVLIPRFLTQRRLRVRRVRFGTVSETISPRPGFVDTVVVRLPPGETCLARDDWMANSVRCRYMVGYMIATLVRQHAVHVGQLCTM